MMRKFLMIMIFNNVPKHVNFRLVKNKTSALQTNFPIEFILVFNFNFAQANAVIDKIALLKRYKAIHNYVLSFRGPRNNVNAFEGSYVII